MDAVNSNSAAEAKADLELQKLRLEIAEIRRSPWAKPSVIIPIAATIATLTFSQYLGVFDVERKRVELAGKEAETKRIELSKEIERLTQQKVSLQADKDSLAQLKVGLGAEVGRLRSDAASLKKQAAQLRSAAAKSQKDLDYTRTVLALPVLTIAETMIPQEHLAELTVKNAGRGSANIRWLHMSVDGERMEPGPRLDRFRAMFKALHVEGQWIRWSYPDSIESGEDVNILKMIPSDATPERYQEFQAILMRVGVELCYCSRLGDCSWAVYNRPSIPTEACSGQSQ